MICYLGSSCSDKDKYIPIIEEKEKQVTEITIKYQNLVNTVSQLRDSLTSLTTEVEKYQTDPSLLIAKANNAYKDKDKETLADIQAELMKYHPQSEEIKQVEVLYNKLLKEEEAEKIAEERRIAAEKKAEERRQAAEERKNPHTALGLAKKAARGGWVVGVWQMGYGHYTSIVSRNGVYYMCDLTPSVSSIDSEMRLRMVGDGTYKAYNEEDDDAIYVVTPEGLAAYQYGTQTGFWVSE